MNLRHFAAAAVLLCSTTLGFSEVPDPIQPKFTAEIRAQLSKGETVLFENPEVGGHAGIAIELRATRDEVWAVLMDPESATGYQPNLRSCKILKRTPKSQLIAQEVKIGILPAVEYQFLSTTVAPKKEIEFRQTEGDLREFAGGWLVVDGTEGKTILFHQVYLDPGVLVPQSLVQRSLRSDLPPMMEAIRARVYKLQKSANPEVAAVR